MDFVEYFKDMLMRYPAKFALNRLKSAIVEINVSKHNGTFFRERKRNQTRFEREKIKEKINSKEKKLT